MSQAGIEYERGAVGNMNFPVGVKKLFHVVRKCSIHERARSERGCAHGHIDGNAGGPAREFVPLGVQGAPKRRRGSWHWLCLY